MDAQSLYSKHYRPWEYSDLTRPEMGSYQTQELSPKDAYIKGVLDALQHLRHFPKADPNALAKALVKRLIEL